MRGTTYAASDVAEVLKKQNKNYYGEQTWLEAYNNLENNFNTASNQLATGLMSDVNAINKNYGSAVTSLDIAAGRQESQALQDFSANISEAYEKAMLQQRQIAASNLGQGFKTALYADTGAQLDNAYNSYLRNYAHEKSAIQSSFASDVSSINSAAQSGISKLQTQYNSDITQLQKNYTAGVEEIDKQLETQATNTADFLNSTFDYIVELYDKNKDDSAYEELFNSDEFADYMMWDWDESGNWVNNGIKDKAAIRDMMFDEVDGAYQLNERGKNFFAQMLNMGDGYYSFESYLENKNPKLLEWAYETNPYDVTDGKVMSNSMSALALAGIDTNSLYEGYKYTGNTVEGLKSQNKRPVVDVENTKTEPYLADNVKQYDVDSGKTLRTLNADYEVKGNPKDEDNNNFNIVMNGRRYWLEMVSAKDDPSAVLSGKEIAELSKSTGGLKAGQLYYYDGSMYYSFDTGSGFKLRKVQGQGGIGTGTTASTNNSYAELLGIFEGTRNYWSEEAKRYSNMEAVRQKKRYEMKSSEASKELSERREGLDKFADFLGVGDIVKHQRNTFGWKEK